MWVIRNFINISNGKLLIQTSGIARIIYPLIKDRQFESLNACNDGLICIAVE